MANSSFGPFFSRDQLGRDADPRAALRVGDRLEADGGARLLPGREQGLKLTGGKNPVAGPLLAQLEGDDRIARALAEVAVVHADVEPEPDERVLRVLAGRERQRQERRLLRGEVASSAVCAAAGGAAFGV